jgi:hypothetical protein
MSNVVKCSQVHIAQWLKKGEIEREKVLTVVWNLKFDF